MNIDENVTIFKILAQVDKHLDVHYAKWPNILLMLLF